MSGGSLPGNPALLHKRSRGSITPVFVGTDGYTMSQDIRPDASLDEILDEWDDDPAGVARKVIDKYGKPDGVTPKRLIWYDNGPWKRTVMRPDGADHAFPDHHVDYLEQVIEYRVPTDRTDEIIKFDGSVTIRRTRGELSAECHGEAANFLALNLTHDILEGDKTVAQARDVYSEIYARKNAGDKPDYIQGLQFDVPNGDQTDPDMQTLTEEHKEKAQSYLDD